VTTDDFPIIRTAGATAPEQSDNTACKVRARSSPVNGLSTITTPLRGFQLGRGDVAAVAGDHDRGHHRAGCPNFPDQIQPGHARHRMVGNDGVERPGIGPHCRQRPARIVEHQHAVIQLLQPDAGEPAHRRFIVDDEDVFAPARLHGSARDRHCGGAG